MNDTAKTLIIFTTITLSIILIIANNGMREVAAKERVRISCENAGGKLYKKVNSGSDEKICGKLEIIEIKHEVLK